tara:strand:+ start:5714 stop:5869 length:156 start_codon:yes stop_codon:yes gene_type:complete
MRYRVQFFEEFIVTADSEKDAIKQAREKFKKDINIGAYRSQMFKTETHIIQ